MKLTPQHHRAIDLLITGKKNFEIAEELGVDKVTVSRWRSDYVFQAEMNQRLKDNTQHTQDRLRALADTALATIETVMADSNDDKARLQAAFKVLEMAQVKVPTSIGSTNPRALQRDDEMNKALDEFDL